MCFRLTGSSGQNPFAVEGEAESCALPDQRGRGAVGPLGIEVVVGVRTGDVGVQQQRLPVGRKRLGNLERKRADIPHLSGLRSPTGSADRDNLPRSAGRFRSFETSCNWSLAGEESSIRSFPSRLTARSELGSLLTALVNQISFPFGGQAKPCIGAELPGQHLPVSLQVDDFNRAAIVAAESHGRRTRSCRLPAKNIGR